MLLYQLPLPSGQVSVHGPLSGRAWQARRAAPARRQCRHGDRARIVPRRSTAGPTSESGTAGRVSVRIVLSGSVKWARLTAKLSSMLNPAPARKREGPRPSETRGRSLDAARLVGLALVACLAAAVHIVAAPARPRCSIVAGSKAELHPSSFSLQPSSFSLQPSAFPIQPSSVAGTVLNLNGTPHPGELVLLRRLEDGGEVGRVKTDSKGAFRLGVSTEGVFLLEVRSQRNQVVAVSDPLEIGDGPVATAAVHLRADVPWYARSFGNTAAAAVAAASAHGITALGSSGLPASPQ
jgi:hypothetical protein